MKYAYFAIIWGLVAMGAGAMAHASYDSYKVESEANKLERKAKRVYMYEVKQCEKRGGGYSYCDALATEMYEKVKSGEFVHY